MLRQFSSRGSGVRAPLPAPQSKQFSPNDSLRSTNLRSQSVPFACVLRVLVARDGIGTPTPVANAQLVEINNGRTGRVARPVASFYKSSTKRTIHPTALALEGRP